MTDDNWPTRAEDEYAASLMANAQNPRAHGERVARELNPDENLRAHENSRAYRASVAAAYFKAGLEAGRARHHGQALEAFRQGFQSTLDIGQ